MVWHLVDKQYTQGQILVVLCVAQVRMKQYATTILRKINNFV